MQAVIMAGGEGKRLRPITDAIPKSLVPIRGVPILLHILSALPPAVNSVILVIGYKGELIKNRVGDSFRGIPISYIEQPALKGTADALWRAKDVLEKDQPFLVLNGDDYYDRRDLDALIRHPRAMGVVKNAAVPGKGYLPIIMDEAHYIVGWDQEILMASEHPSVVAVRIKDSDTLYVNAGAYMLDHHIFDYAPVSIAGGEFGLPQTMLLYANDYPTKVIEVPGWMPLNTHDDLKRLEAHLAWPSDILI